MMKNTILPRTFYERDTLRASTQIHHDTKNWHQKKLRQIMAI